MLKEVINNDGYFFVNRKRAITRSIMLENYGGKRFEKLEIYVESEDGGKFETLNEEVNAYLAEYIKHLPEQLAELDKAKQNQSKPQPFKMKSIVSPEQQERHDKKMKGDDKNE